MVQGPRQSPRRFFLRDAVAILPGNRRNLLERLQRGVALAEGLNLNLEITLDARFFVEGEDELLTAIAQATSRFPAVIYHLHSSRDYPLGFNGHTQDLIQYCLERRAQGALQGLCIHPDLVTDFEVFLPLVHEDFYVAAEVLDEECGSFNTLKSIQDLLARHEYLGLVLDTAHIAGMEPAGEPPLEKYIEMFAERTVEVHISQRGNLYDPDEMGPGFHTNHSLLSMGQYEVGLSLGPLATIDNLNMVIEGVIPAGEYGNRLLKEEVRSFTDFLQ
nr:hypothetical protein [Candidatus Krumholzibacteria bacterium]